MGDATKQDKAKRDAALENHQLDNIDAQIIELMKDFPSMTDREIADVVGLSRQRVCTRRNAPKFKAKMAEINRTPEETLREYLKEAAANYVNLAKHAGKDHGVREKANAKILTSFGVLKNGTITFVDETTKLSDEELLSRAQKLIEEMKKK